MGRHQEINCSMSTTRFKTLNRKSQLKSLSTRKGI